jgi:hypothetical protein
MIDRREEVDSNLEDLRRWSLQNENDLRGEDRGPVGAVVVVVIVVAVVVVGIHIRIHIHIQRLGGIGMAMPIDGRTTSHRDSYY